MCLCVFVCFSVSVCLFVCVYVCVSQCMYVYLSVFVCVSLYMCLSLWLSLTQCLHFSLYVCMSLSIPNPVYDPNRLGSSVTIVNFEKFLILCVFWTNFLHFSKFSSVVWEVTNVYTYKWSNLQHRDLFTSHTIPLCVFWKFITIFLHFLLLFVAYVFWKWKLSTHINDQICNIEANLLRAHIPLFFVYIPYTVVARLCLKLFWKW